MAEGSVLDDFDLGMCVTVSGELDGDAGFVDSIPCSPWLPDALVEAARSPADILADVDLSDHRLFFFPSQPFESRIGASDTTSTDRLTPSCAGPTREAPPPIPPCTSRPSCGGRVDYPPASRDWRCCDCGHDFPTRRALT